MRIRDRIKRFIWGWGTYNTVLYCSKCGEQIYVFEVDATPQEVRKIRDRCKKFTCENCKSGQVTK